MGNITSADISKIGLVERYKLNILDMFLKNMYTELIFTKLISNSILYLDNNRVTYTDNVTGEEKKNINLNHESIKPSNDIYVSSDTLEPTMLTNTLNVICLAYYNVIMSYFTLPLSKLLDKNALALVNTIPINTSYICKHFVICL